MDIKVTLVAVVLLAGALSACTTTREVIQAVPDGIDIKQAQSSQTTDTKVRWGGDVVKVSNFNDHTLIEIIYRPLDSSSAPRTTGQSDGRFLARINQFIDPENAKPGRRITVRGVLGDWRTDKIGEFDYQYPLVSVEEYKIWPKQKPRPPRYRDPYWGYPYWYDPFWGYPFYPGWPHSDFINLRMHHRYYR